jgi:hypothetical protein
MSNMLVFGQAWALLTQITFAVSSLCSLRKDIPIPLESRTAFRWISPGGLVTEKRRKRARFFALAFARR